MDQGSKAGSGPDPLRQLIARGRVRAWLVRAGLTVAALAATTALTAAAISLLERSEGPAAAWGARD